MRWLWPPRRHTAPPSSPTQPCVSLNPARAVLPTPSSRISNPSARAVTSHKQRPCGHRRQGATRSDDLGRCHALRPDAWSSGAREAGRRGGQRILHAGEVTASAEVARMLGLAAGETVVVRRRLIELDGEPVELRDTYYPADVAVGTALAAARKIRGGAVTLLADLGYAGVHVVENITARMPEASEQQQLRLGPVEPVLQLARTTYDSADRPIQADVMVMPAGRQQLQYEIRIG
ncbi:GntR family transcriptional regulator [Streptomyces sp. NPDC059949]|uniref:GntR family transcriptional regulator n=1 Tax=Streptomyces sp. NPDC059949 TaxID=3347013 RepID=UPI00365A8B3B